MPPCRRAPPAPCQPRRPRLPDALVTRDHADVDSEEKTLEQGKTPDFAAPIGFWRTAEARDALRGPSGLMASWALPRRDSADCSCTRTQRTSRLSALQRGRLDAGGALSAPPGRPVGSQGKAAASLFPRSLTSRRSSVASGDPGGPSRWTNSLAAPVLRPRSTTSNVMEYISASRPTSRDSDVRIGVVHARK